MAMQRVRGEAGAASATITLGPRDTLTGKLRIEGGLRVQGKLEGEVRAGGDIQVDQSGKVTAFLEAANVNVRGQVNGNVVARGRLLVGGSGELNGDVQVSRLNVEDGGTLNGSVTMHSGRDSH